MAKNKTAKKQSAQPSRLSPERWMREKARTLPLGTTYMNYLPGEGTASVLVSRIRPSGNVAMAMFLVDTFCLGVKECYYMANLTPEEYKEKSATLIENLEMKEVPYPEAHNLIYGAVEWAGEADILPAKEWAVAKYILDEDTDEVPYIEYEFGDNGLHHLIVATRMEDARLIPILQKRLGDKFVYTRVSDTPRGENSDILQDDKRFPSEPYSYPDRPEYPAVCEVKNEWLREALSSPDNLFGMSRETVDRIMALPADEAADDIARVILWTTGQTLPTIEAESDDAVVDSPAVLLGLMLLSVIDSRAALPAVIDTVRQSFAYSEAHLGDYTEELLAQALFMAAGDNLAPLAELLTVPGIIYLHRYAVATAIGMAAVHRPHLRNEAIDIFRRELERLLTDVPALHAADGSYAGLLMCMLEEMHAVELLPEIRALFDARCVNRSICSDYDSVAADIADEQTEMTKLCLQTLDDFDRSLAFSREISESETL